MAVVPKWDQDQSSWDATATARRVIFVNSSGTVIKATRKYENVAGVTGTADYVLATADTPIDIVEVYLDGVLLTRVTQYTVDNTTKTITFIIPVFDLQVISVAYYV